MEYGILIWKKKQRITEENQSLVVMCLRLIHWSLFFGRGSVAMREVLSVGWRVDNKMGRRPDNRTLRRVRDNPRACLVQLLVQATYEKSVTTVESVRPVRPTESYSTWYPSTLLSRISSWTPYHQELSTLGGNVRRHYINCPFPISANDAVNYIDYIEDQGSLQILSDSLIDTTPTCFYTKNFKLASADLQSDVRTTTNSSSQFYKNIHYCSILDRAIHSPTWQVTAIRHCWNFPKFPQSYAP